MYVRMYVCMFVCMYVCMHVCFSMYPFLPMSTQHSICFTQNNHRGGSEAQGNTLRAAILIDTWGQGCAAVAGLDDLLVDLVHEWIDFQS